MNYLKEAADWLPRTWQGITRGRLTVSREQSIDDVLAQQANDLNSGMGDHATYLSRYRDDPELAELLSIAEHAHGHLYPVAAASGFQDRLLHDLMRQAHSQCEKSGHSLWEEKRKEIIIGATITSLISAAGVLAYLMHILPANRRPTSTG